MLTRVLNFMELMYKVMASPNCPWPSTLILNHLWFNIHCSHISFYYVSFVIQGQMFAIILYPCFVLSVFPCTFQWTVWFYLFIELHNIPFSILIFCSFTSCWASSLLPYLSYWPVCFYICIFIHYLSQWLCVWGVNANK